MRYVVLKSPRLEHGRRRIRP